MDWAKSAYNDRYDKWVPWIEDLYLKWFTNDNKVSYTTKQNLDKTKLTGIKQVDSLQDGVNNLVTSQLGQEGLLAPVTDIVSQEGVNRAERKGKDEQGRYIPGGEMVGNLVGSGAEAGKSVGGLFGSKCDAEEK